MLTPTPAWTSLGAGALLTWAMRIIPTMRAIEIPYTWKHPWPGATGPLGKGGEDCKAVFPGRIAGFT